MEAVIEAILFTMGESVELKKIAAAIEHDEATTRKIIHRLQDKYEAEDRGLRIIELEDSFQLCTKREMYDYLIRIAKQPKKCVLTDVLLETLSIIAYRQPVTKLEIEKIRGVKSDHANIILPVKWEDWMHRDGRFYLVQQKNSCEDSVFSLSKIFRACSRNR